MSEYTQQIKTIKKFCKSCGVNPENVNPDNYQDIVKDLAVNFPEILAAELEKGFDVAVKFWEWGQTPNTTHFSENYDLITDNLACILGILDIKLDYPGLYPTFELTRNGRKFSEYSALNAIRQYNHW